MSGPSPAGLRLAFVSAPGGSAFMEEILSAVADATREEGVDCITHRGHISEVAGRATRFVVIPHEYFALAPREPEELYSRTIGFGVEHPGTQTFSMSVDASSRLGARFELSPDAVRQLRAAGLDAEHFQFGYVESWDHWCKADGPRPIDVLYLGTADDRRLRILARASEDLDGLTCEFLIPPHEPMTRERPDFLRADKKWDLLTQCKVLINLHREDKVGFEWIRCIEAMINGCVVVSEPSRELDPLVPGEHILIAEADRIGAVARAVAADSELCRAVSESAYDLCRSRLRMQPGVRRLATVALTLDASAPEGGSLPSGSAREPVDSGGDPPLAVWIPEIARLPVGGDDCPSSDLADTIELARLRTQRANLTRAVSTKRSSPKVDVVCVQRPEDGPLGITIESLRDVEGVAALHVTTSLPPVGDRPHEDQPEPKVNFPAPEGVATHLAADLPLGRGWARNRLLSETSADLVCIIDAGDALRPGALLRLRAEMEKDPDLDIITAMATHGRDEMANVLVPEARRMRSRVYLTRGYLVRRAFLEQVGGYPEDPLVEGFVDHLFWRSAVARGASIRLCRWIGFSLWRQAYSDLPAYRAPQIARAAILSEA